MGGRSRSVGATLIAGFVALGLACAGDDAGDPQATDTPDAGSDGSETLSPEAEVEAAYLAYWDMLDRLAEAPDPDDPEIRERASGEALLEVVAGLQMLVERGHAASLGPTYSHTVMSVDIAADHALVRDCVVDDSTIVEQATGEHVSGGELATELLEVSLVLEEEWTVDSVERIPTEPGSSACEGEVNE